MAIGVAKHYLIAEPTEELDHKKMTASRGRRWAVASLVCAALARAVAPFLFGLLGVAAGTVLVAEGARWWGAAGVSTSTGALVISLYVAGRLVTYKPPAGPFPQCPA